ncbi:unnamed protein product [Rotaria sp. Silwood2]|nr:unnamed protein product [Rotaria sp. Silwood2]
MQKSESLGSLNLPTHSENSILTSTFNPASKPSSFSKLTRRMNIIPTPNKPDKLLTSTKTQSCSNEDSSLMNTVITTEKNARLEDDHVLCDNQQGTSAITNLIHNQSHQKDHISDEEGDDSLFDTFICENFVPFSGAEPIDQWLDETDALFHRFKISRKLRFQAIPLLVQGDAKRKYINNRHAIKSFDDFYEFLLTHFDSSPVTVSNSKSSQSTHQVEFAKDSVYISNITTDSQLNVANTTGATQLLQSSVSSYSKLASDDTTTTSGDVSDSKLSGNTSTINRLPSDPVITDLRKAIVTDFIRNPKIFRGNKDDVIKWLEDIDHLMHIAHVPDTNRLDLISYSLRGDASQWFRNNKSVLTSWDTFVQEIKKAFTSSFSEELAFKTLESYTQGEKQSVRNFFNEALKLCKKADPNMSESTKLKTLLNKVKPSMQLEIRKKKPKTPAEFLEYAKEIEELLQLSNISTDTTISSASKPKNFSKYDNTSSTNSVQYSNSTNSNYRSTPQTSFRTNQGLSNYRSDRNYVPKQNRTQASNTNYYYQSPRPSFSTNKYNDNTASRKQNNIQQHKSFSKHDNKATSRSVNAVFTSTLPPNNDDNLDSLSTVVCHLCNYMGHDASSCPNFQ